MKIEEMMRISHILTVASIVFAAAAVILFFAFDIVKCCRMLSARHARTRTNLHKIAKTGSDKKVNQRNIEQSKAKNKKEKSTKIETAKLNNMETILLNQEKRASVDNAAEALLLNTSDLEGTTQPEMQMELIQDIVYVQNQNADLLENEGTLPLDPSRNDY